MTLDSTTNNKKLESSRAEDFKNIKKKLSDAGYSSFREIALSQPLQISKQLGINLKETQTIILWATKNLEKRGIIEPIFSTAKDIFKSKMDQSKLTTGCTSLDEILGGGIEVGALTEFYGQSGTGKSQICYNLSFTVQQSLDSRGLEAKAMYIETEGKFTPERILQIAKARNANTDTTLEYIFVVNVINSAQLEDEIGSIQKNIKKDPKIKLVVIDSIINLYRQEFLGRENLPERQSRLHKSMGLLTKIAKLYNVAVVVTNQVSSSTDPYSNNQVIPAGGNVLAHMIKHRIFLKAYGQIIHAKIVNSPSLPQVTARFSINESGITDIER